MSNDETTTTTPLRSGALSLRETARLASISVIGLFVLAVLYTVHIAKPFLLPLVLALLVNFVFRPVHRRLERLHIPPVPAAAIILLLLATLLGAAVFNLVPAATGWAERLPESMQQAETNLRAIMAPVRKVSEVAEQVDELAEGDKPLFTTRVEVQEETWSDAILAATKDTVVYMIVTMILLFFILAYGGRVYKELTPRYQAWVLLKRIDESVSSYLFTITVINASLGLCIGLAMYLLGMPNPVLWGVMGWLLNYIPYLGAIAGVGVVLFIAAVTFDILGKIILVPVSYFALTALEGNFVTPMVLGQRFTLNPIIIFVWVVFWGWIWGVPGMLIAVPLLMVVKIFCEQVPALNRVAKLMSV